MKRVIYAIDACALIAFLRKEVGSEKMRNLLKESNNMLFMHAINLGEVYYDTLRVSGIDKANELFQDISILPLEIIWDINVELLQLAGKYKTTYSISYADAFALALSETKMATLVTTDHSEFDAIEKKGKNNFFWLR